MSDGLSIHRDSQGIIGQTGFSGGVEGGDSACWQGHWMYLTSNQSSFDYDLFEVAPGAYVRHPVPGRSINGFGAYYKNVYNGCISRDQLTGILGARIAQNDTKSIWRIIKHAGYRLGLFAYNTIKNHARPSKARWQIPDLTLFDIWAMYLRGVLKGRGKTLAYPLLCILDLQMLFNALLVNRSNHDDQINFALKLIISRDHIPTFISMCTFRLTNISKLIHNIRNYWSGWRDNPGMVDLYIIALNRVSRKS